MLDKFRKFLKTLGPGVITGASDNDPAGVSTYSVAGASTGYQFLWLSLLSLPLMIAVQDMSARIGVAKGEGLGQAIEDHFGKGWLSAALVALIISNIATIGADLAGISAAFGLIFGVGIHWFVVPVALLIVVVEVFWSYKRFARYLQYLTLVLFSYVAAGFIASPDWSEVLRGTFIPIIHWSKQNLSLLVAMLGTTISPYMFFWQASEEVEELQTEDQKSRDESGSRESRHGRLMDTISGMVYAVIVFYFIVLTSAATLHATGKTDINTAADAARALEPIAGHYASLLFSVGIIGAGLIAVPVLAGATAYPLAERLGRPEGLDKSVAQAKFFYGVLGTSVLFGMAIALTPINPIDALVYSQVLMGLLTPVLLVLMMLLAGDRHVMGDENVNNLYFNVFGWAAVVIMVLADLAMVWTFL